MNNEKDYTILSKEKRSEHYKQARIDRTDKFNALLDRINTSSWNGWEFSKRDKTYYIENFFSYWKKMPYWDFDKCEKALYKATFTHDKEGTLEPFAMAYSEKYKIELLPLFGHIGNQCLAELSRTRTNISSNNKLCTFLYADIHTVSEYEYIPIFKYKKNVYMLKVD